MTKYEQGLNINEWMQQKHLVENVKSRDSDVH